MLTFDEVIHMLLTADAVIISHDSRRVVAEFVGYDNEGDEDSTFSIGTDHFDDCTLYPTKTYVRDCEGIHVDPDTVLIPVKYMKP